MPDFSLGSSGHVVMGRSHRSGYELKWVNYPKGGVDGAIGPDITRDVQESSKSRLRIINCVILYLIWPMLAVLRHNGVVWLGTWQKCPTHP